MVDGACMYDNVRLYVQEVVEFSSQYGSETNISYTVSNIAGRSSTYPSYGDFTQTAVLVGYLFLSWMFKFMKLFFVYGVCVLSTDRWKRQPWMFLRAYSICPN